jgi:hypothetical protein
LLVVVWALGRLSSASGQTAQTTILNGCAVQTGYVVGLNTSGGQTNWLSCEANSHLVVRYPAGQSWGAVFFTYGPAVDTNRPGQDLSAYQTLTLEMSGDGGTSVDVGIKDAGQRDEGGETKLSAVLTADWQNYTFPLTRFTGADLRRLYVVAELVFSGASAQTVRVRRIVYSSAPALTVRILPHLAFGGGWYSALYFTNTTGNSQSFSVNFVGNDGAPLTLPSAGGSSASVTFAPRGTAIIEVPNSGPLRQGYVSASLPDGVTGYGVFRATTEGRGDQEAVVPLSGASATTCTLIWDDTDFVTAVAIVNPGAAANNISVTIRDEAGEVIGRSTIPLAARSKTAAELRTLPGLSGMPGRRGSADFTADTGSVAVLGLRFGGAAFTSIPTADR